MHRTSSTAVFTRSSVGSLCAFLAATAFAAPPLYRYDLSVQAGQGGYSSLGGAAGAGTAASQALWVGACSIQPMSGSFPSWSIPIYSAGGNYCPDVSITAYCAASYTLNTATQSCDATVPVIDIYRRDPPPNCPAAPRAGNPILPTLGTKHETVNTGLRIGQLEVTVTYDSLAKVPLSAGESRPEEVAPVLGGSLWSGSLHRRLLVQANGQGVLASRGDGRVVSFNGNGSGTYTPEAETNDRLLSIAGGYRYIDANSTSQETYNSQGKLIGIAWAGGNSISMTYSDASTPSTVAPAPGYLIQVQDVKGRTLNLRYQLPASAPPATGGRLSAILDAAGQPMNIAYDAAGNMASLQWADGYGRTYLYEQSALPWALTGVIDERSLRHATFGYDTEGRAISTEYTGGVNRFSASYGTPPRAVVTEVYDSVKNVIYRYHDWAPPQGTLLSTPQGSSLGMGVSTINGKTYMTSQSQPAGSGCAASTSTQTFDANGNLSQRDDFNGKRICYANDLSRNLETVRVEGLANSAACGTLITGGATLPTGSRKVSTQWHPDWRLETKLAEPGRLTTKVYNGQPDPFNGAAIASCAPSTPLLPDGKPIVVLCKSVEQATTDANGATGFSAALQSGVANRTTTWTYNQYGQVLTEDGPRTDASDITTYTYHTTTTADYTIGDLKTVTNAAGKVTTYSKYNKHGQLLESTDPNGVVTVNTYDLRQRLKTTTVGTQTTSYDYDAVGQLKKVTQPDGSWLGYDYDDAHRQVAMYDHLGNRVDYTLDNAGNRIGETTKNNAAVLKRQLGRSIDALGRVQQTTGKE